jgi:hypothetical protein
MVTLTIEWGEAGAGYVETYSFNSVDEANGFRMGLYESQGWQDYQIVKEEVEEVA